MRANLEQRWPSDADDNIERLANAGLPYDRQVIKCRNCGGKSTWIMFQIYNGRLTHAQNWATAPVLASRSGRRLKNSKLSAPTAVPGVIVFGIAPSPGAASTDAATVGEFCSSPDHEGHRPNDV